MLDSDFLLLKLFPDSYPSIADYMFLLTVPTVFATYYQFSKVVITSTGKAFWARRLLNWMIYTHIAFFAFWGLVYTLNRFVFTSATTTTFGDWLAQSLSGAGSCRNPRYYCDEYSTDQNGFL